MDKLNIALWLAEHLDTVIGFIVLLVACLILPKSVRWYVFSAGSALLLMNVWQMARAREKLKKLDAERSALQQQLSGLKEASEQLKQRNQALEKKSAELELQRQTLLQRQQALAAGDVALQQQQDDINQQVSDHSAQRDAVQSENQRVLDALAKLKQLEAMSQS